MKIAEEKALLRNNIRDLKKLLTDDQKQLQAHALFSRLEVATEFIAAQKILIYWSMPDELPTHEFIEKWSNSKQFFLPVVKGEDMIIQPFISKNKLKQSNYGIWEPDAEMDFSHDIDLVIVPGVAFDKMKFRIGRGKGYYDKFLHQKTFEKWGICFDIQLVDQIPVKDHDVAMDKVFTPSHVYE